jgi:hypothetical protein
MQRKARGAVVFGALALTGCGRVGYGPEASGDAGAVGAKGGLGASCAADDECADGHCVEGSCCDGACNDACTGCVAGTCVTRAGVLRLSGRADRAEPVSLAGQTLPDLSYIFAETCAEPDQVAFFIDEVSSQARVRVEGTKPFDLAGTVDGFARPAAAELFFKGNHTMFAELIGGPDNGAVLAASYAVPEAPEMLIYSAYASRVTSSALDGAVVSGSIFVALAPGVAPAVPLTIDFFLDDPGRTSPVGTESHMPYDLAGTASPAWLAKAFDTTTLANGAHTVEAVYYPDGLERIVTATFTVAN